MKILYLLVALVFILTVTVVFGFNKSASFFPDFNFNKVNVQSEPEANSLLLPDLKAEPPAQLFIDAENGGRVMRFSTTFGNVGDGPFEALSNHQPEAGITRASQVIYASEGERIERLIGEFVFHTDHEHWHIENYVIFELWNVSEDWQRTDLVASTEKMSFCIWDELEYDLELKAAVAERVYQGCDNEVQGLSVGWSDTYAATVHGQELDIARVANGNYLVRTIINPDRAIWETNYENNTSELRLSITGDTIEILEVRL